ncbi:hypothetical protein BO71DRAFT_402557 [Aspergillus ellipticus CBS 707.79]|uniref:Uncharacterized protein n=1 Tax=Aspergillus ellipticus CBS 707.79 TaxID=1448320 RepID=A0A319CXW2_9EURO|nr:hypothetical protein BO71DRAFT_402557 [Aspergillus ellipticus CBS 707.79]
MAILHFVITAGRRQQARDTGFPGTPTERDARRRSIGGFRLSCCPSLRPRLWCVPGRSGEMGGLPRVLDSGLGRLRTMRPVSRLACPSLHSSLFFCWDTQSGVDC